MKSKIKLTQEFICKLPTDVQDSLAVQLEGVEDKDNLHIHRKSVHDDPQVIEMPESEKRITIGYHSTRTLDRDGDIIIPGGMSLEAYRKNPVLLWSHNWSDPPIGRLSEIGANDYGLRGVSEYADTDFAGEIWKLVKGKFLRTHSIGFIPTEWISKGDNRFNGLIEMALREWPEFTPDTAEQTRNFITRGILLESSVVPIPSNTDALVQEVIGKGYNSELIKSLGIDLDEQTREKGNETDNDNGNDDDDHDTQIKIISEPIRVIKLPENNNLTPSSDTIANLVKQQLELEKGRI